MKKTFWVLLIIVLILLIGFDIAREKDSKATGESVKIGVIAPLSGVRADAGEFTQNGILLALEDLGREDRKYKLEFVFEDSQYKPDIAVSALQKLITHDDVDYIIGPYGSSQVLAVAPVVEEAQKILITPGSQSDEVTYAGDYIFRNIHNARQEAPVFAKFVAEQMSSDVIHFFVARVAFTETYLERFISELETYGKQVGRIEYFDVADTDFRTQLAKIKAENPSDIFPLATPKHMGLILQQADDLGIDAQMYHIGVEGPDLLSIAGDNAEGIYYPYSYDSGGTLSRVKIFYETYIDRFGTEPDTIAANAYDATYLLSNCFEKVGVIVEDVQECLYDVEDFEGASGTYSFDEYGDAIKDIFIKTVRNGKFVRLQN